MEYRICFPQIPNMGDLLNKDMLEQLFGISVKADIIGKTGNMLAIGSGLKGLLYSDEKTTRAKQRLRKIFHFSPFYVWGTGFINYNIGKDKDLIFRDVRFLSLRGNLTKMRIEKIIKKELDIPTGDGGLLASLWLGNRPNIKYKTGIIPHFREKESPIVEELKKFYNDSVIIDLADKPIDVVRNIASCETIISSSLHGLIISDSFHIPNKHVLLYPYGEKMKGDGYKFADYYSSYGLCDTPIEMNNKKLWPTFSEIQDLYQIDSDIVEKKKKEIFSVFPK